MEDLSTSVREEFKENEDLPNTTNPDDWARISGRKGERIINVRTLVESRWLFLLGLNLFLLAAGCLLDIFSAIVVLVPLITPVAAAYGIHPLHLGVIFLANMELGYLTPPVGMNLFLAAFRFERPLMEVYRASLPFFLIMLAGVLVITYLPWLSTALPGMMD